MELSDPVTPEADAINRRKSGRAKQKPVLYQQDPNISIVSNGGGKRKRAEPADTDMDGDSAVEESSLEDSEGDPDEEELKEKRRRPLKAKAGRTRPAAKKPKSVNNGTTKLAMRPAINGVKKAPKPRKPRGRQTTENDDEEDTGLYAEVFSQGDRTNGVAADWIQRYDDHNANAMCEFVNFVLKCTGCNLKVDVHDIEDPDNVTSKLSDLQDEYQAQKITDYPLISKARGTVFSRSTMTNFVTSLTINAHASGLLYDDLALIENIQVWVTTMSSSAIRPFRHTATVISLALASAICGIMKEIYDDTARTIRQKESERKKKPINKERVAAIEAKIRESEKKRELAETWLRDMFDTVFIHRYRDIDPRIRVDCSTALGHWITTCPDIFFEGQYLRYLGWVLSDVSSQTRAEVVKQLLKLYKSKDNVGRLRAFTERFRPRMVEMAVQDAETSIRASAIELLTLIRDLGFLEPDDTDTIGKLVFDTEPRVRKAVAGFFAANVNDMFESTMEELGGEDGLDEIFCEEDNDGDYDNPRKSWLKMKCLAEVLQSYDSENCPENSPRLGTIDAGTLCASGIDSRYSMAAQAICQGIPEIKNWEVLAGYLLFDHSSSTQSNSTSTEDGLVAFKARCQPTEMEERLLLEILVSAVKAHLTEAIDSETDKKGKRTKARKDESREIQETTALHLAQFIPRLLRKFGANPSTASAVLRLEHVLNLEIFQELRQDSIEYASLLDDINKQFLTHADQNVLAEASTALLHARGFEDLEEITESKMQELWDDTIGSLRALSANANASQLTDLCNTVCRMSSLASISDCTEIFEAEPRQSPSKSTSRQPSTTRIIDILLNLLKQYASIETQESDILITGALKAMLFYYMWTARSLRANLDSKKPISSTTPAYMPFSNTIITIISSRPKLSSVRLAAIGTLLDLHTLFATFRHLPPASSSSPTTTTLSLTALIQDIPSKSTPLILSTFLAAEKSFARKAHRTLDPPSDSDPPDSDLSSSSSSSDEDEERETSSGAQARQHSRLLAEKRLCELGAKIVLAIVARVLDNDTKGKLRERLERNKLRLGGNFKEVLGFLEERRELKTKTKKGGVGAGAGGVGVARGGSAGPAHSKPTKPKTKPHANAKESKSKSAEIVESESSSSEDEDVDEEMVEVEEGGSEDLRRRELDDGDGDGGGEGEGEGGGDEDVMGD